MTTALMMEGPAGFGEDEEEEEKKKTKVLAPFGGLLYAKICLLVATIVSQVSTPWVLEHMNSATLAPCYNIMVHRRLPMRECCPI